MTSGGADAAAGFRYQHLVTVEALLDLFDADPSGAWVLGVDVRGQDSADYAVFPEAGKSPSVVVQVKSSMVTSSTRMTAPEIASLFASLRAEHPDAPQYELRTNRKLTAPARAAADALLSEAQPVGSIDASGPRSLVRDDPSESVDVVTQRLHERVGIYRTAVHASVAGNVALLIVSRLRDLVDEVATATEDQYISAAMVAEVLRLPGQELSQASGGRQYGRMLGFPSGDLIDRTDVETFLDTQLTDKPHDGTPSVAAVTGLSGAGKSSAVAAWARSQSELYFCLIWLSAHSEDLLEGQIPALLDQLGEPNTSNQPPVAALHDALRRIPFPWLLIFDGVSDRKALPGWLPSSGYGHVVITTNDSTWPQSLAPSIRLDGLTDNEAQTLIARRLPSTSAFAPEVSDQMNRLAATMGHWPLAIDSACHWIARRGGNLAQLDAYLVRVASIDLDDERSVPSGYPRTAVAAIRITWEELSEPARRCLALALLCGGADVPVEILDAIHAAGPVPGEEPFEIEKALDELLSTSLVHRYLADTNSADDHGADRIGVHDAMKLVANGRMAYPSDFPLRLMNVLDERIQTLRNEVRLYAAASYLPAAIGLLSIVSQGEHEYVRIFAPMMHNVGEVLLLTGAHRRAVVWFGEAAAIYAAELQNTADPSPDLVDYFLGTTMKLSTAALRSEQPELIEPIARTVATLLEDQPHAVLDPRSQAALEQLAGAVASTSLNDGKLRSRLEALIRPGHASLDLEIETPLASWSITLFESVMRAARLIMDERWGAGMDDFLSAANATRDSGALQYEIVEAGIRIGIALTHSRLQRYLAQPPAPWHAAWRRYAEWCLSLEDIPPHQQAQLDLLREGNDPESELRLKQAIETLRSHRLSADETEMWESVISDLTRDTPISGPLEDLMEQLRGNDAVTLTRMINGGNDVSVWLFLSPIGLPGVAFVSVSAVRSTADGWIDPLPAQMQAAGFPSHDPSQNRVAIPDGWIATIRRRTLMIEDSAGTPWLTTDLRSWDSPEWSRLTRTARFLHVVYADIAGATAEDMLRFPYQAVIELRRKRRRRESH